MIALLEQDVPERVEHEVWRWCSSGVPLTALIGLHAVSSSGVRSRSEAIQAYPSPGRMPDIHGPHGP